MGRTHDKIDQIVSHSSTKLAKYRAFIYKDLYQVIKESYKL
jgi:hypothetical protein